jgi:hypothetical protein
LYTITWSSQNLNGDVQVKLIESGSERINIATLDQAIGSYNWLVPDTLKESSLYKIRLVSVSDSSIVDDSDNEFTIEPFRYDLVINTDSTQGSVIGGGRYLPGDTVAVQSNPNEGYLFENWTINGQVVSSSNPYSIVVDSSITLSAVYKIDPRPKPFTVSFGGILSDTVGATIKIPIEIASSDTIHFEAFEFSLNYDTTIVELLNYDSDSTLTSADNLVVNDSLRGKLIVAYATSEAIKQAGNLLNLTFKLIDVGVSDLTWDWFFADEGYARAILDDGQIQSNVIPRLCGDVTDDGAVTNLDATYILRHGVKLAPQFPLIEGDSVFADVTGNGSITSYDASQILKDVVGNPRTFNCEGIPSKILVDDLEYELIWSLQENAQQFILSAEISVLEGQLNSFDFNVRLPEGFDSGRLSGLPDNIQVAENSVDNLYMVSAIINTDSRSLNLLLPIQKRDDSTSELNIEPILVLNEKARESHSFTDEIEIPKTVELNQNYPNPFNPSTNISFSIPSEGLVRLEIFNLLGQKVSTLINERMSSGNHLVEFNANQLSTGVYVYRLSINGQIFTRQMLLLK